MNKLAAGLVASLLALAVACGGSGGNSGGTPDAAKVLGDAQEASKDLRSFHFVLTHENGSTPIILNLDLERAEGDYAYPDKLQGKVKAKAGPISVSVEVASIGGQTWITNPFTGKWQLQPDVHLSDFADPGQLVSIILAKLSDAKVEGTTEIDGIKTYELRGDLDAGELEAGLPVAEPGQPVKIVLWIGADDSLPRRARIEGRMSSLEDDDIVRVIDLSRLNQPVDIQPPV